MESSLTQAEISNPTPRFIVECIWMSKSPGGISHVARGEAAAIRPVIRRSFDAGTTIDNDSIAGIGRIINESRIQPPLCLRELVRTGFIRILIRVFRISLLLIDSKPHNNGYYPGLMDAQKKLDLPLINDTGRWCLIELHGVINRWT